MKIIVYPHELTIGGSQINAIDLAASVAAKGHNVIIYGTDGPLVPYIRELGLKFVKAIPFKYRPAPAKMAQLYALARCEKTDLIHTYEWPPCLDAYLGAGLFGRVPVLATILDMTLSPFIPPSLPLIMGTAELTEKAREIRPGPVWSIEPPIDTQRDHPGLDGSAFRQRLSLSDSDLLFVTVSRLAVDLKLDALVRAIDSIDLLASRFPVRLAIVGGGPAGDALLSRGNAVNARHGREVVSLVGEAGDPRSAYAAADVVLGMGSSALRALSIGRPLIVQGEEGFSRIFAPDTIHLFMQQGFYGHGNGKEGPDPLAAQIESLLADRVLREALGQIGRATVEANFSLEGMSKRLLDIYETVSSQRASFKLGEVASVLGKAFQRELHNHEPKRKRDRKSLESLKLRTAASGKWPPSDFHTATE
ncbi:glycosyltransferase family 4 protein [Devosia sp. A449]